MSFAVAQNSLKLGAQQFDPSNRDRMPHMVLDTFSIPVTNVAIPAALTFFLNKRRGMPHLVSMLAVITEMLRISPNVIDN